MVFLSADVTREAENEKRMAVRVIESRIGNDEIEAVSSKEVLDSVGWTGPTLELLSSGCTAGSGEAAVLLMKQKSSMLVSGYLELETVASLLMSDSDFEDALEMRSKAMKAIPVPTSKFSSSFSEFPRVCSALQGAKSVTRRRTAESFTGTGLWKARTCALSIV